MAGFIYISTEGRCYTPARLRIDLAEIAAIFAERKGAIFHAHTECGELFGDNPYEETTQEGEMVEDLLTIPGTVTIKTIPTMYRDWPHLMLTLHAMCSQDGEQGYAEEYLEAARNYYK